MIGSQRMARSHSTLPPRPRSRRPTRLTIAYPQRISTGMMKTSRRIHCAALKAINVEAAGDMARHYLITITPITIAAIGCTLRLVARPQATSGARRKQTRRWFVFYTLVMLVIVGASLATHQWSVAITALMVTVVFGLYTWRLSRKR